MALFAAYAEASKEENEPQQKEEEWLSLSSFKIDVNPSNEPKRKLHSKHLLTSDEEAEPHRHRNSKKKKRKKSKHRKQSTSEEEDKKIGLEEEYTIDKKRILEYNNVRTIARPSAPKYPYPKYRIIQHSVSRKSKFKRYFENAIQGEEVSVEEKKITKQDLDKPVEKSLDAVAGGMKHEEEMTKMTSYYNKSLADEPNNIELWLKYVEFQDTVFQFEKTFRKGSIAKGLRVTAERKLSILDKALTYNPDCEELLRTRLNVAVSVYPADELQIQLGKLVEKERANIILWQGYIEATQCSMSHCNTPAVLPLYIKCLHTLHTLRRTAKLEKGLLEENILRMLYQCGLFLKQAGLFEQLWTLLRLYLELNLSPSNESKFGVMISADDKQLVELEEVVLNSQLPIHELWLRIEKLREACHWLPCNDPKCEDPQRVVLSEDVSELIHPITVPGNTFKLTVTILTLLKIPLLPCRHTTMQEFGIDYVPWALDAIESLLPIFFPIYPIDLTNKHLLRYTQKLAVGPQYLKTLPGQEEYLQFILTIMKSCMDCLQSLEQTAIGVWWFRFQSILIILEKSEMFKITSTFKKKLKTDSKNVLKENTTNVVLFKEYALLEASHGNIESAINILETTINSTCKDRAIGNITDLVERASLCAAFRSLIELHLKDISMNRQKCLKYFIAFVRGENLSNLPRFLTQGALNDTKNLFSETTSKLLENYDGSKQQGVQHFLPDLISDWIICHGWFLYLNDSFDVCRVLIENVLDKLEETSLERSWHKEQLIEFKVAMLFKECTERAGSGLYPKLDSALQKGIELYPNNLFLLSSLAKVQLLHYSMGQPWWKVKSLLLKSGHALPSLFLVLIANQRISDIEENWIDSITGKCVISDNSFKNRMLSLFRRLTSHDICTRRCGLMWRLYLQFLHAYFDPKVCRNAYYAAVEECPWFKALYIDAAIYIPEELPQIQDLIIEKQLRIHVTPEELDVLRN